MADKHYAHALIEGDDGKKYQRGDVLPAKLEGLDELVEAGSASTEPFVEHRDIEAADSAGATEKRG